MRYRDPATGRWLDAGPDAGDLLELEDPDEPRTRLRELGATIVNREHGSFLSCGRRLGCTNPEHVELKRAYDRAKSEERRRRAGERPTAEAHPPGPHGTVSRYRKCTAGPDGRACRVCKDAEADRVARWRASKGRPPVRRRPL